MADRSLRWLCKALAACCLASSVAWLTGATAARDAAGSPSSLNRPTVPSRVGGPTVRALQLNLCDSGAASCFTGRSVGVAAAVIRDERPDIVTLNEVCRADVSVLRRAMSATHRGAMVAAVFKPAEDRRTKSSYRCRNGQQYGIGVLALIPSSAYRTYGGVYPTQDLADPEERVWLCIDMATEFLACTTHAASTVTAVALSQCRYLLKSVVPMLRSQDGDAPVILGADLNLPSGRSPGPQSCLPDGYQRADDGSRQDILTSPGIALRSRTVIDMHGATDHPGLLVELALPHRAARVG
jgi:endonuclease/exonuclease/phosphatase family metal-dependent hydrolase